MITTKPTTPRIMTMDVMRAFSEFPFTSTDSIPSPSSVVPNEVVSVILMIDEVSEAMDLVDEIDDVGNIDSGGEDGSVLIWWLSQLLLEFVLRCGVDENFTASDIRIVPPVDGLDGKL